MHVTLRRRIQSSKSRMYPKLGSLHAMAHIGTVAERDAPPGQQRRWRTMVRFAG